MTLRVSVGIPKNPFVWDYSLLEFLDEYGKCQWSYQNRNRIFALKYVNDFDLHHFFW